MCRSKRFGWREQRGSGGLRMLVTLAALGLVASVFYLLVRDVQSPLSSPSTEAGSPAATEALPVDPPPVPDPVLTKEVLQQVQPAEQVESPPDGRDDPPPKEPLVAVPRPTPAPPLPGLDDSDASFRNDLLSLDPSALLADLLIDEELIRKFVVLVDNMAEGRIPRKHSLLAAPKQKFKASEVQDGLWLDGFNFGRYDLYVRLFTALDAERTRALYQRYYPLMQQAYAELGYPRRSFHQRLLQALDHVLDSPVMPRALALEQPSVMYKFADPEIEQLSAVHKQMLRLGAAHATKVLERATQLRTALGNLNL